MQITNKQRVLDAVIDLHNQEQIVTRETLSDILDLKRISIDESLSTLVNEGFIYRVVNGVYVPMVEHKPARLISKIPLPDGTVVIDIGDSIVLTLTPKEARTLGSLMMCEALQYSNIESGHHAAVATAKMDLELKNMRKALRELSANTQTAQAGLF